MKKETGKTGGWSHILDCMYARDGGGGHSDAYCVQQGGGSKNRGEMRM